MRPIVPVEPDVSTTQIHEHFLKSHAREGGVTGRGECRLRVHADMSRLLFRLQTAGLRHVDPDAALQTSGCIDLLLATP